MLTGIYRCLSSGPRNNGLLRECGFTSRMQDGYSYHCPLCAGQLKRLSDGPSLSEVLAAGAEEAKLN